MGLSLREPVTTSCPAVVPPTARHDARPGWRLLGGSWLPAAGTGDTGAMTYPDLDPTAGEPVFGDPAQLRAHRKRRLALGYRIFGALRYGSLGDGHISARD